MKSNTENYMASFDNFMTSLRSEFGEQGAGKKFEVFCKWFLENDPEGAVRRMRTRIRLFGCHQSTPALV